MVGIVGVSGGDAREQVLVAFARKQIAVAQSILAELGQKLVALAVGLDLEARRIDALAAGRGGAHVVGRNL